MSKKLVLGILAHVDAGKTTLSESLLYKSGVIRKVGRVDNGDTALDTHTLEKERGITIFAGQSVLSTEKFDITLLDTPGHVDFSAETERVLKILDYAVLVISGTDGVQAHTRTLWKLLKSYNIPTFIFVTKMDFARYTQQEITDNLKSLCGDTCVNFSATRDECFYEDIAVNDESALEEFLENNFISDNTIQYLINSCKLCPCFFGSGLKMDGVDEFLSGLDSLMTERTYPDAFGAKVFKITHDSNGERLTHLKITGGSIKVKDLISYDGKTEKINNIRVYSGAKFKTVEKMSAGGVCVATGLSSLNCGDGLGFEENFSEAFLEPVMNYRVKLPSDVDAKAFLPKLKLLEAEDPQLHISWNGFYRK